MEQNFNQLSPEETERLAILMEECAEVQQIVGKILRHGYESYNPASPHISNRMELEREIGDVIYAINLLTTKLDVSPTLIEERILIKEGKTQQYLHHN